jgi:hypothetical protein
VLKPRPLTPRITKSSPKCSLADSPWDMPGALSMTHRNPGMCLASTLNSVQTPTYHYLPWLSLAACTPVLGDATWSAEDTGQLYWGR